MRKLIGGEYVAVEKVQDKPPRKAVVTGATQAGAAAQSGGTVKPGGVTVDVSKNALGLMSEQPAGMDWSGLAGSGINGQVTVADVRAFLAAQKVTG